MRCYLEQLRSRMTCCNDRSCNVGYVDDALVSTGAFFICANIGSGYAMHTKASQMTHFWGPHHSVDFLLDNGCHCNHFKK